MRSSPRRRAAAVALALSGLSLAGCQVQPPEPSLTPRGDPMLDMFVSECGGPAPTTPGDRAFSAEVAVLDADGMRMDLDVATAGGAHGEHELGRTDLRVLNASGLVAGVVMADAWRDVAGLHGTVTVELRSCPDASGTVGDPLADGEYSVVASGTIRPLDHDHARAETWEGEPVPIVVAGGAIQR